MRKVKILIILGIALLFVSFVPGSFTDRGDLIYRDEFQCYLINGSGNLWVEVYGADSRNISLYVLDYDDTLSLVEEGTLENTDPLFSIENVENFVGSISLPEQGWYGVIIQANITNPNLSNMRYDIYLTRELPHKIPFILFISSEIVSFCLLAYIKYGPDIEGQSLSKNEL